MPKASSPSRVQVDPALKSLLHAQEATLPNGLSVRLLVNHQTPVVSLYTFFRVGSRDERPGLTGLSHLCEHLMFGGEGPARRASRFDHVLESNGGRSNAYTSPDMTVFREDFPTEALETVLELEAERMRSPSLSEAVVERERRVVMAERRARVEGSPVGLMSEELNALAWKAHPYRWPVIGWMKDLEHLTRKDCEAHFRTYYVPGNAALYISGDIDPDKVLAWVRRAYGDLPRRPRPAAVVDAEPPQRGERRAQLRLPVSAPAMMLAWRGPAARETEDTAALDVLQYVLAKGNGGRLVRRLVYTERLALSVGLDWASRFDPGAFVVFLELKPGVEPRRVEELLDEELARLVREGPSEHEMQKARNNLRADLLRQLSTNSGRAYWLGLCEQLLGSWEAGLHVLSLYESIQGEQVREALARYLRPERRSVVTLLPGS
ncbi:M16 family metallopeptidase [Cystobacter fuscus]|uniref:M16 family metallopeptidase n=1 Tax=Cystobacter fuscus TaxID=43 RepID=UPI002B2F67F0|nr:insulinase family protein [Cystobacter fuscus]